MRKLILSFAVVLAAHFNSKAQQGLTIVLDTKKFTNLDCSLNGGQSNPSPLADVYAHTGICTTGPIFCATTIVPFCSEVWQHVVGNWGDSPQDDGVGRMTNEGNGVFVLKIRDYTVYYGSDSGLVNTGTISCPGGTTYSSTPMPSSATAYTMGIVFRSADATTTGRDNFCNDIFITSLETDNPVVVQSGDPELNPWPNSPVTFRKIIDGVELGLDNQSFINHKKVYPNPFKDETRVEFYVKDNSAAYDVSVYDLNGKKVNNLLNGRPSMGLNTFNWNGTDFAGNKLPHGIYYFTIKHPAGISTDKLIITE